VKWREELEEPPFVFVFIRTSKEKEKRREESQDFVAVRAFVTFVHALLLIQREVFPTLESLCVLCN
jgi:hypothetical protein